MTDPSGVDYSLTSSPAVAPIAAAKAKLKKIHVEAKKKAEEDAKKGIMRKVRPPPPPSARPFASPPSPYPRQKQSVPFTLVAGPFQILTSLFRGHAAFASGATPSPLHARAHAPNDVSELRRGQVLASAAGLLGVSALETQGHAGRCHKEA